MLRCGEISIGGTHAVLVANEIIMVNRLDLGMFSFQMIGRMKMASKPSVRILSILIG